MTFLSRLVGGKQSNKCWQYSIFCRDSVNAHLYSVSTFHRIFSRYSLRNQATYKAGSGRGNVFVFPEFYSRPFHFAKSVQCTGCPFVPKRDEIKRLNLVRLWHEFAGEFYIYIRERSLYNPVSRVIAVKERKGIREEIDGCNMVEERASRRDFRAD